MLPLSLLIQEQMASKLIFTVLVWFYLCFWLGKRLLTGMYSLLSHFSTFVQKLQSGFLTELYLFSSRKQNEQFLVDWAAPHLDDLDSLERITDPRISGSMPPKAISSLGIIILLCIKVNLHSLSWCIFDLNVSALWDKFEAVEDRAWCQLKGSVFCIYCWKHKHWKYIVDQLDFTWSFCGNYLWYFYNLAVTRSPPADDNHSRQISKTCRINRSSKD